MIFSGAGGFGLSSGGCVRRGLLLAVPLALLAVMVMAAQAHAYLYFGQGNGSDCPIGRADLDGLGLDHSFITKATCGSPAVDSSHIYWSGTKGIGRANIDGTRVDRRFIAPKGGAFGVAAYGAHIYWTGPTGIGRANLDGRGVDPTFLRVRGVAQDLAVDSTHIYWMDAKGIGRANIDGTHPMPRFIVTPGVDGIALNRAHIYWANFGGLGTSSPPSTIGRANLDGTHPMPRFITGAHNAVGIGVEGSYIYWANYGSDTIGRARLDGRDVNENFIRHADATGLAVNALGPPPGKLAEPRASSATEHFRKCGKFNAHPVRGRFEVYRVSCAKARRILSAYLHQKERGPSIHRVKAFPAWSCSTGNLSGLCSKGRIAPGVPEIAFNYQ